MLHTERMLRRQVWAMRRLPPGAALHPLLPPAYEHVIQGLIGLHDDTDPLSWLTSQHGSLSTEIALWRLLTRLYTAIDRGYHVLYNNNMASVQSFRQAIKNDSIARLDSLINRGSNTSYHPDRDVLTDVVRQLQARFEWRSPSLTFINSIDDEAGIVTDLLALPTDVDPVQWALEHHSRFCAVSCLRYLLGRYLPQVSYSDRDDDEHIITPTTIMQRPGLFMQVSKLSLGPRWFTLHCNIKYILPRDARPYNEEPLSLLWGGFDRVNDDQGYRYLVVQQHNEGHSSAREWREYARITCYPTIGRDVKQLYIEALPVVMLVINDMSERKLGGVSASIKLH